MPEAATSRGSGSAIDVPQLIAQHKFGRYQFWIIVICGLAMFSTGFNNLALGYIAPAVTAGLHLKPGGLTIAFAALGFGAVVSGLTWGPIGDRIGRKVAIVIALICAVPFTYMIGRANSVTAIAWYEFFASFCLYGVVGNAMPLAGEFMPKRSKVTLTVLVWTGYTAGTIVGSPFAAFLVKLSSWRSVFLFNAITCVVLVIIVILFMQESLNQLVRRGTAGANARIAKALKHLYPHDEIPADAVFITTEKHRKGFPVRLLFTENRAKFTILLWIMGFANIFTLGFMNAWLTTTLHNAGLILETAILVAVAVHIGGAFGGIIISGVFDRSGHARFYVIGGLFLLACVFTASIGLAGSSLLWAIVTVFMAGFFVYGLQNTYNAIVAVVYPTEMRSTGNAWAHGIYQMASIFGPVVGGILIGLHWPTAHLWYLYSFPPIVAGISATLIGISRIESKVGALEEAHVAPGH